MTQAERVLSQQFALCAMARKKMRRTTNVWVRFPAGQVLLDHASLFQKETPIREEHPIPTCRRVINLKRPLELGVKTRAFVVQ
jgi:hypothetical protein